MEKEKMQQYFYRFDNPKAAAYKQVCITKPPSTNSKGGGFPWGNHDSDLRYSLPLLEFHIVLIIFFNFLFASVFKYFGLPRLVRHLSAGLCIGGILRKLQKDSKIDQVFPLTSQQTLSTLAGLGYMFFLFLIGVKIDMRIISKSGKKAMAIGVVALVAPFIVNMFFVLLYSDSFLRSAHPGVVKGLFVIAVTQSLTAFPVISYLLGELKILNSEIGRLALSSAVISEFLSMSVIMTGTTLASMAKTHRDGPEKGTGDPVLDLMLLIFFIIVAVFGIRPAMFWVIRNTPEGRPVKDDYVMAIIVGVLFFAMFSHAFGHWVLFAPYIIGLVTPDGPPLGSALVHKLETLVSGLLLPIFLTNCGVRVSFSDIELKIDAEVISVLGLAMVTSATKITGCLLVTRWGCKMPLNDALALSLIMSAKGIVELGSYSFLRDLEKLSENAYAVSIIATMVQAGLIPVIVRKLYDPSRKYAGYQKRNITHLRSNDELRLLICIHKPANNISSAIKLLDISNPTPESPISVSVLHLIELVGRATPMFISHQYQSVSHHSYSENVMIAFDQYEANNRNFSISVQTFTAISPIKLMDEDICTLALDKLTSLIILPFHRYWGIDGTVESEYKEFRVLNKMILERAPCSVGILIDRARLKVRSNSTRSSSSSPLRYRVANLFIGGPDDREAFAYATRMAQGKGISSLTVIRFVVKEARDLKQSDTMMDTEILMDVKEMNKKGGNDHKIEYKEQLVFDGPELALRVRQMVNDYELLIVGRQYNVKCIQTSGLEEFSEFPELGVLGDLLASPDFESGASVLIIQTQRMI